MLPGYTPQSLGSLRTWEYTSISETCASARPLAAHPGGAVWLGQATRALQAEADRVRV